MADHHFELRLLGPFEVWRDDTRLKLKNCGPIAKAILTLLAAESRRYNREELIDLLAIEAKDPRRALRWHVWAIQEGFRENLPEDSRIDVLITDDGDDSIRLDDGITTVDCATFKRLLSRSLKDKSIEDIEKAVNLYRGDFLTGSKFPKMTEIQLRLLGQRPIFQGLYEEGLIELIQRFKSQGQSEKAIIWAQKLVQTTPVLEKGHEELIELYALMGRKDLAIQQFEICRDFLSEELGVEPSPRLKQLYDEIRSGRPIHRSRVPMADTVDESSIGPFTLVGRKSELLILDTVWQASFPKGKVVLVESEAGGGKTRLVTEFTAQLSKTMILTGQCYESTQALPYYPWVSILEAYFAELDDDSLRLVPSPWLDQLIRFLSELAKRLGKYTPLASTASVGQLESLFSAVVEFLLGFPETTPKLIFIDNLQWADEPSLILFHRITQRMQRVANSKNVTHRVLLIGSFRPEEVFENTALQKLINDLHRTSVVHLTLAPLDHEAISTLISKVQPELLDEYLQQLVIRLVQATDGNPFFVTAVLNELNLSDQNRPQNFQTLPLPADVRESIRYRLQKVPEVSRQVLEAIAIFGVPITPDEARRISGRSEEETDAAIDLGLKRGLLEAQEKPRPTRYDCAHDLISEVIILDISRIRRQKLHRRAAKMLISQVGQIPSAQRLVLASRIIYHAREGEEFKIVLNWVPLAAQHGREIGAHANALVAYEYGSEALPQITRDNIPPEEAMFKKLNFILSRAELLYPLARREEGEQLLEEAAVLLVQYPFPELQAKFHLIQAYYWGAEDQAEYEMAYEAAFQAHELFLKNRNVAGAAESLFRAGEVMMFMGDIKEASKILQGALAFYRTDADKGGESVCLGSLGWCALLLGEIENAIQYLEQAIQTAEKHDHAYALAHAYGIMAAAWYFFYDVDQTRSHAQKSLQLCSEMKINSLIAMPLLFLGASYLTEQVYEQAEKYFKQALTEVSFNEDFRMEGWATQALGRLALRRGDISNARQFLSHAHDLRARIGDMQGAINDLAWLARLALVQGNVANALETTTQAVEQLELLQEHLYVWETHDVWLCHAQSLYANGRESDARKYIKRAYEELMQFAERINDPQTRERYLAYPISQQTITAWESRRIPSPNNIVV